MMGLVTWTPWGEMPQPRIGIDPDWRNPAPYGCACHHNTRRVVGCVCHAEEPEPKERDE